MHHVRRFEPFDRTYAHDSSFGRMVDRAVAGEMGSGSRTETTWHDSIRCRRAWAITIAAWLLFALVGQLVWSASMAWGADSLGSWPQWRGPQRNGVSPETGLLSHWPSDGPPLLWQGTGAGEGYASVALAEGRLFTMGNRAGRTWLVALDDSTGEKVWETPLAEGQQAPNCTPTIDGDRVYAVTFGGDLVCCDRESGEIVWRTSFQADFGGRMMSGWGYSESPLIDGDRLLCTPGARDAMLAALDKRTGRVLWRTSVPRNLGDQGRDGAAYSSIVISQGAGTKQYVQLVGRGLVGVAATDGRLLWNYNRIANGTANCPTPVVRGNYVFASTGYGDGGSALLELRRAGRDRVNAREVYYFASNQVQNHHGGMILIGDHLYLGHGHNNGFPLCLHLVSGREMWRPGRGPGSGSAAISYADGHLYFRYQDGIMALIEADPREYRLKGEFRLASRRGESWPHPAIANGRMYLRDQDVILCYDLRDR
jgi:outer membrane protein assembly factor BamB